jgi:cytochrome c biogenesis protein CcdA/thiol-disulfide isomerase/thioredoxin
MLTLALIGLVGGLITGVSPCVLPMLPIVFFAAGHAEGGRTSPWRAVTVIAGLVVGFSFFTLLGTSLLALLGLPDSFLRWAGVTMLALVGIGMLIPAVGHLLERPFYRLPKVTSERGGPFVLGLGLGTLFVPCAGPVLAAITVAGSSGHIGVRTLVLTLAFAVGAALPLLIFAAAGSRIRVRIGAFRARMRLFQVVGGVVLIGLAVGLSLDLTAVVQRAVPNYTKGLEDRLSSSDRVRGALSPFPTSENRLLSRCVPGDSELADCGLAPPLRGTGQWFNTPDDAPLTLAGLRGNVVLLDFFAYSCINCQRDQPYVEKWSRAYESVGLKVVGVHSPEFSFERSAANLAQSLQAEGTTYPVVQDNALSTWSAYRNRYWPAKYLIDGDGVVRAIKFGEGDYAQTEKLIRRLLKERDPDAALPRSVTATSGATLTTGRTPELYLAKNRPGYVGIPKYVKSTATDYSFVAGRQPLNTYGLSGSWQPSDQGLMTGDRAELRVHFRARSVFHVLGGEGTVTVSRRGHPTKVIRVSGVPNLHRLLVSGKPVDETLTLTYSPGVKVYTFTFG